jgi:hypothetical protein
LEEKVKVIFCLPGRTFSDNFLRSWNNLVSELPSHGVEWEAVYGYSPNLYYVRNMCLGGNVTNGIHQKPWGGKDYDYMMWIDSDIVFKPEHFFTLLDHKKDIVSGLYMMQGGRYYATVKDWDEDLVSRCGYFPFLTREDVIDEEELMTVSYTGLGWILIKRGVFETLEYPWFRPEWYEFDIGGVKVKEFAMEDVTWCHATQENGFDVYVDPKVIVGHEKKKIL